jgi:nitroimidazol reductase NimA-like FMN-containing flavoprotein (pyridoxamine 5'-phosphate oxidase superfamily)
LTEEKYGTFAMTPDELDAFLAEQDVVYLATLRKSGAPLVVPVGFDWDGESFFITIALDHAGLHRLRRDPRVSLSIGSHPAFPTKFVVVEGIAEEVADPGHTISRRILFRKTQEMFARMRVDPERYFENWISVGRVAFRIRATSVASFDGTKAKGAKYSAGTRLPTDSTRDLSVDREHPA